ncbi:ribonuclease J [Serpentinicella alkaliphila]|uniref:Ribonuclease J n=1 Tax=Serpentinicella alkaliphila TaxID=1734049 RepID=A0A4R2TZ00_9FIRM|nr:ribonuclease J [Serpentinicella alkaliphila]QUH26679.1 ribonuclease J [Serpentinicella alkaliphila]TCQ00523.1 ribonuclease J [Serpentinicella alkaliphila]
MGRKPAKVKVIPLGGLNEIGKNMTAIEYKDEILIIDCGLSFPEDEMLGIDIVIPDISYVLKNKDRIQGIVLTHGHEDHIGALPYVLKKLNVPVYGTRLTLGLVDHKLKEHKMTDVHLQRVNFGDIVSLGAFNVEFIRTSHSIPDSCAIAIHTSLGVIFHTGDFKIDYTPINDQMIDLHKIAELGQKGVLLMLADSTNVERPGTTMSERNVGITFENVFRNSNSRIIVATFASNVHRIQQIVDAAFKFNRKIVISGRSMVNVISVAQELGAIDIPDGMLIDINDMDRYNDNEIVLITTGSQGEPMAALSRMASADHRKLEIRPGDKVVISATPIPGNEKSVTRVINQLFEKGADVIYESLAEVHVSGHACQEELKLMHRLVKPQYFMPVHGEFRHLKQHGKLAEDLGMSKENIFTMQNGSVLELSKDGARIAGSVPAGRILVDGLGVGDVGNIVLRDRKHLSEDGLMVVVVTINRENGKIAAGPDIISRGFVYVRESEDLIDEAKQVVKTALIQCEQQNIREWAALKNTIRDSLKNFLYEKTKRRPMILPVIMEV